MSSAITSYRLYIGCWNEKAEADYQSSFWNQKLRDLLNITGELLANAFKNIIYD